MKPVLLGGVSWLWARAWEPCKGLAVSWCTLGQLHEVPVPMLLSAFLPDGLPPLTLKLLCLGCQSRCELAALVLSSAVVCAGGWL